MCLFQMRDRIFRYTLYYLNDYIDFESWLNKGIK